MYRAGDYAQLKDLQERLENLKEDALAGTELPDAAHCFSMLVTDGEKVYGINHLTGGIFTISGENGKAVYTDVATMQDTKILHPRGGRLQLCPSSGHGGGIGQYCADADEHMGRQGSSDKPLRA